MENYKQLYSEIIKTAKSEKRNRGGGVYYERHHIIPEFMFLHRKRKGPKGHLEGNPNDLSNLVLLTFQEHLMCHYYLYEILKHTHYKNSAGSALQFFFVHAVGGHVRQRNLADVDKKFLDDMAHIREIGIKSISAARTGKFPAVDAITRQSVGSVETTHPKVISGEWVHHSTGRIYSAKEKENLSIANSGKGNPNFKEMTPERKIRVFSCVSRSIIRGMLSVTVLEKEIKTEFSADFKKISFVWLLNNFVSYENLICEFNKEMGTNFKYVPMAKFKENYKRSTIK